MRRITQALFFAFLLFLPVFKGHAQSMPAASSGGGAEIAAFAMFNYADPDYGPNKIYGGTAGGFLQSGGLLGVEGRVEALRYGNTTKHQYAGLLGPRVVYRPGRFPKWDAYAAVLGGEGRARYPDAKGVEHGNMAFEWRALGGLDYHLTEKLRIRAVEIGYSHLYVLENGLTPIEIGAGVVYRIR